MKFQITILIFLFSLTMMSQKKASLSFNNTPLNDVITELENKFGIKLSFNPELITNQLVNFNKEKILLEDIINVIERQTDIAFEKVTQRYYIIKSQAIIDFSQVQNLEEIVISEYLTSGINKKQDGSITLSPTSLGILPGLTEPDVLQSLQLLPGVQSPLETASGLYIRGGTPDQNLILWDGIKMYHSGHFFGMISAFNPYIIKDVKLFTGGTNAKYGSRISSVIDITSSNKIPKKTEAGGGFNLTHTDVYIKAPLSKKMAIMASARRSFSDVFETITFKNISKKVFQNTKISDGKKVFEKVDVKVLSDLFYFSDVTLKAIVNPSDKDEITVSNLFTKNKLDNGFEIKEINQSTGDKLNIKNRGSSILWNHSYSSKFSHAIQAYISSFDLDYDGINGFGEGYKNENKRRNSVDDFGLSFNTNWYINDINSIGIGYQLSSQKIGYLLNFRNESSEAEPLVENYEDTKENKTHSVYTDYQYKKENKLSLNVGLRTNYISALNTLYFEPRLHLQMHLAPHLKFKFSVEKLHQSVSQIVEFIQEGDFELENQTWVLADGETAPILKSFQITSGWALSKNGWTLDLDGYLKKIKGLSSLTKGFDNPNDVSFFSGKSDVLGIDILIKKKINNYRTWLSYSYLINQFTFGDVNDGNSFSGNFDITHHFTWSHSYLWNNFNFSLGWNIRTGTPHTEATGINVVDGFEEINYSKTNGKRLPNYHRLDFSSTYKFNFSENKKWKGKLGFSLLNIYNNKSLLSRTYKIKPVFNENDVTYDLQKVDKISLGITPNLLFRVEF